MLLIKGDRVNKHQEEIARVNRIPLPDDFVLAESVRQSHCDRKGMAHKCVGVMTVGPKGIHLNCRVCGDENRPASFDPAVREYANEICDIFGVSFDSLGNDQKRRLLLEIAALGTCGY